MPTSYVIERCLGRGGFGEVYLAVRRAGDGLDRKVAVKVLRDDVHNPAGAIARLQDEGRLLAMLDHPAIVRVVELTKLQGRIALVTEYVDGVDVSRFSAPGNLLPPRAVAELMAEVARALHCAAFTPSPETGRPLHLIHRDVKPENIRISRHGETKLLDFGIARTEEVSRNAQTTTGNVPFTLGYTAPETFLDLLQHPPSDVFAWGATAFRLFSGERFYGELKLTEQATLSGSPTRYARWVRQQLDRLPTEVTSVRGLLEATLAYDPADRPPIGTAGEALETLAEALPGPALKRWVREATLPEDAGTSQTGGLVGSTLSEDHPEESTRFGRPSRPPPPPPPPPGLHIAPRLRQESSLDRPLPAPPPPSSGGSSWMVRLGAGVVVVLLGMAIVLLLVAVVFSALWLAGVG